MTLRKHPRDRQSSPVRGSENLQISEPKLHIPKKRFLKWLDSLPMYPREVKIIPEGESYMKYWCGPKTEYDQHIIDEANWLMQSESEGWDMQKKMEHYIQDCHMTGWANFPSSHCLVSCATKSTRPHSWGPNGDRKTYIRAHPYNKHEDSYKVNLFLVNRLLRDEARRIFYSQNEFRFDTSPGDPEACLGVPLAFFRDRPWQVVRNMIHRIHITAPCRSELFEFILRRKMSLHYLGVTFYGHVPTARLRPDGGREYEWHPPGPHEIVVQDGPGDADAGKRCCVRGYDAAEHACGCGKAAFGGGGLESRSWLRMIVVLVVAIACGGAAGVIRIIALEVDCKDDCNGVSLLEEVGKGDKKLEVEN
ncbi:uncharacterized protein BDZ99DRAFT_493546 [Mytilinidion resinicola]|uniref:Uncharacterized protein n=1 Tax=Mytilinidion resinicola TaxID=574789 RepID=A0A6A6ZAH8_9PEZI|nr:uncharacterized protein BDZ99DRAFT_493546 [Mytilinidion resinicola]KAF2817838.1 hypothetical protein BDZ99DRAFT_493546 [Mytilinidion resinicola]